MAALSSAMDSMNKIKLGENMNMEYKWNSNYDELIVQFYFQLTRTSNDEELKRMFNILVIKTFTEKINIENIKLFYKLIGNTRDIVAGKGEYSLTYMMISELYKFTDSEFCPKTINLKIKALVYGLVEGLVKLDVDHPYGSWKDMKYLCNYHISECNRNEVGIERLNDGLINKIIQLIVSQLECDENAPVKSLLARWIPREKSEKFGWLTGILATNYYKDWYNKELNKKLTSVQKSAARRKCLTHFRKLVSKINKDIETTQVYQCSSNWQNINFEKNVTSITMRKQAKAFQNVTKNGSLRNSIEDRILCKEHYEQYIRDCNSGKVQSKGKRIGIKDFVKDAILCNDDIEKMAINSQWKENSSDNNKLKDIIAMVDTSASMECDDCGPLYSAIGLGIRIAEKSNFGKRVLTFSSEPSWVNLDSFNFVEAVKEVRKAPWGQNTNFRAALELILKTAVECNVPAVDMQNMTLIILSDMQIDMCRTGDNDILFETMRKKYAQYNYNLPHIVFWNLRNTNGFPNLSSQENTSMMSGVSPTLLNKFCENGVDELKSLTPLEGLKQQLDNKRYRYLENIVENLWNFQGYDLD